jgi:hypothetical protein
VRRDSFASRANDLGLIKITIPPDVSPPSWRAAVNTAQPGWAARPIPATNTRAFHGALKDDAPRAPTVRFSCDTYWSPDKSGGIAPAASGAGKKISHRGLPFIVQIFIAPVPRHEQRPQGGGNQGGPDYGRAAQHPRSGRTAEWNFLSQAPLPDFDEDREITHHFLAFLP